jgi:hypothetical protein
MHPNTILTCLLEPATRMQHKHSQARRRRRATKQRPCAPQCQPMLPRTPPARPAHGCCHKLDTNGSSTLSRTAVEQCWRGRGAAPHVRPRARVWLPVAPLCHRSAHVMHHVNVRALAHLLSRPACPPLLESHLFHAERRCLTCAAGAPRTHSHACCITPCDSNQMLPAECWAAASALRRHHLLHYTLHEPQRVHWPRGTAGRPPKSTPAAASTTEQQLCARLQRVSGHITQQPVRDMPGKCALASAHAHKTPVPA